jgi:hypothetical protein
MIGSVSRPRESRAGWQAFAENPFFAEQHASFIDLRDLCLREVVRNLRHHQRVCTIIQTCPSGIFQCSLSHHRNSPSPMTLVIKNRIFSSVAYSIPSNVPGRGRHNRMRNPTSCIRSKSRPSWLTTSTITMLLNSCLKEVRKWTITRSRITMSSSSSIRSLTI